MLECYVAVDLEMTGLQAKKDRILEVGAVKVAGHRQVDVFQSFVNPHRQVSQEITDLTGIRSEMVADAPEDVDVLRELIAFAGDAPLVGHNILFDYSFLKQCAVNHGIAYEKTAVDTLKAARKCLPDQPSKKLEDLCRYYKIRNIQEHRALADAQMTARLLECLLAQFADRYPELFEPKPLLYKVKKQGPATPAQKRDLLELISCHKIEFDAEIESLTKNEASRMIDNIYAAYGRKKNKRSV